MLAFDHSRILFYLASIVDLNYGKIFIFLDRLRVLYIKKKKTQKKWSLLLSRKGDIKNFLTTSLEVDIECVHHELEELFKLRHAESTIDQT